MRKKNKFQTSVFKDFILPIKYNYLNVIMCLFNAFKLFIQNLLTSDNKFMKNIQTKYL